MTERPYPSATGRRKWIRRPRTRREWLITSAVTTLAIIGKLLLGAGIVAYLWYLLR